MTVLKIRNMFIEGGNLVINVWARGRKRRRNEKNLVMGNYLGSDKFHIIPATYKIPII